MISAIVNNFQEFIESVPSCQATASVDLILTNFQTNACDRLIVVNQQNCPLGMIYLCDLLPSLSLGPQYWANHVKRWTDEKIDQEPKIEIWKMDLIKPIIVIPASLNMSELSLHIQKNLGKLDRSINGKHLSHLPLVVVSPEGQLLGLLDTLSLIYYLINHQVGIDRSIKQTNLMKNLSALGPIDPLVALESTNRELVAQNQELTQLNRFKDTVLGHLNHELKTTLTAVLGLSSLLQNPSLGKLTERQSNYAQQIQRSSRQLMTTVNHIIDLLRLENGELKLNLMPIGITEICRSSIKMAKHDIDDSRTIKLEIASGLDQIIADQIRLQQMLTHLLANALKFTPKEGEVALTVKPIGNYINFTVSDTGIGIPIAQQRLLFEKFQQLENPFTREYQGIGLRLALTKRLARLHQGDISLISEEKKGSQFTIFLPAKTGHLYTTKTDPTNKFTVLRCHHQEQDLYIHIPNCHIVETSTSSLEQANILANIWQPNVLLLEPITNYDEAKELVKNLVKYPHLIKIPIVTQDVFTTQLANQMTELAVFPYLRNCVATTRINHSELDLNDPSVALNQKLLGQDLFDVISIAVSRY